MKELVAGLLFFGMALTGFGLFLNALDETVRITMEEAE